MHPETSVSTYTAGKTDEVCCEYWTLKSNVRFKVKQTPSVVLVGVIRISEIESRIMKYL